MIKEFYKDFSFDKKIDQCEIIKSKVTCIEKHNKTIRCQIESEVKLLSQGKEEITKLEIPFENDVNLDELSSCEVSINSISSFITCTRITIYGELEIREKIRESESFKIDPLKESLISSFISYKRNKDKEVEIISTLPDEEIKKEVKNFNTDFKNIEESLKNDEEKEIEPYPFVLKEDDDDIIVIKKEPVAEKEEVEKKDSILQDSYVSSYFYYKVGKNEKLTDILLKLQVTMDEFLKYNKQKEYSENTLLKFKRK